MPVVTTAANAMYAQSLIEVDKASVVGYETVGRVATLDATDLSETFPELSVCTSNALRASDACRLLNTKDYYEQVTSV